MSKASAIIRIPAGRRTKWAVLVFWLIIVPVLSMLAGKLTAEVPHRPAEPTERRRVRRPGFGHDDCRAAEPGTGCRHGQPGRDG